MSEAVDTGGSERHVQSSGVVRPAGVFGMPPHDLIAVPPGAVQFSPLVPGAERLDAVPDGSLSALVMLAPPGTLERRHAVALAIRASCVGAPMTIFAPKDKGGARLARELTAFGAEVDEASRRHHRICFTRRPVDPVGLQDAIAAGGLQFIETLGLWTQPGVFSWDKIDAGSAMLAAEAPVLSGIGADLGCGTGYLARAVLAASPAIARMTLVDVDRRAIDCAGRNVVDARARFLWGDVREAAMDANGLDFVIMNPPFHDGGAEDRALGLSFIRRTAEILKRGGRCWLVANRHLPYEAVMMPLFASVRAVVQRDGFKVYEAIR